ncbi:hypothetical protein GCM10010112_42320 [Actinoplanes lobatus]|uniref:Uncharacterized protein n=1 Tax=Actinoplanes lobatus TaxID=113568 RepID=A0A7W7MEX1_9ACTN|nr:hypothetical protein [Actinoplanes lobatus]MBB4747722.1 hypothetical protein [Actinoplanes lobatus]GGN73175.1 hypothetical protein GCM10010112_42320 [Actinoplanes lobatus]GIE39711.1 hypothetical protein Alo02nite_26090 [Actinoplanes lobatus]
MSRSSTTELTVKAAFGGDWDGIGVKASAEAQQKNNSTHKKTYIPSATGAKICGQNGNPTATEKVLEVS